MELFFDVTGVQAMIFFSSVDRTEKVHIFEDCTVIFMS